MRGGMGADGLNINLKAVDKAKIIKAVRVPKIAGATDTPYVFKSVEDFMRTTAARIEQLEAQLTQSGAAGVVAGIGEQGITQGRLVHIGADNTAWLAVNSNASRPCTHVVVQVQPNGRVTCYGFGHWPIQCAVMQNEGEYRPLWVGEIPGHATDIEPEDGTALIQRIGTRMTTWDQASGLVFSNFCPEFYPTADVAPVKSVNGETGDVVLDYEDVDAIGSKDLDGEIRWLNFDGALLGYNETGGNSISINPDANGGTGSVVAAQFEGNASTATAITPVGLPGQVYTTNPAGDGAGWEDPPSSGGGTDIIFNGTASENISAGQLVHVNANGGVSLANGAVAYLWATHVATSTATTGNSVNYCSVGNLEVPTENIDAALYTNMHYLSDTTPGSASPKPPSIPAYGDNRKLWQEIGVSTELRGTTTTGKTTIAIDIKGPILL